MTVYTAADPTCGGAPLTTIPIENSFEFDLAGITYSVTCELQQSTGYIATLLYAQSECGNPCYALYYSTGVCRTFVFDTSLGAQSEIEFPSGEIQQFASIDCSGNPIALLGPLHSGYDTCSNSTATSTCPDGRDSLNTYNRFSYAGQTPVFVPPLSNGMGGKTGKMGMSGSTGKMGMGSSTFSGRV